MVSTKKKVKLVIDILKEEITNNGEYKKVLKTDLSNINYDLITYVQDRLGHDMRYAIEPSKIGKRFRMVSRNRL